MYLQNFLTKRKGQAIRLGTCHHCQQQAHPQRRMCFAPVEKKLQGDVSNGKVHWSGY